ncbi:epoxide hydrolase N-terminal domain-containing protein [Paenibacillus sp.]|jgi:hypothetical protein|uniref:epoxide hydrolase N-terminal domain-containing protein n=1 Tax=Paenibacillus sp. TaxID=58172 RepID=UPI0028327D3D|nr:epoxide hydrolase N-terminal domain-containing protein [Paenibacillus sp.]MDR0271478.1 epoxide hydrolase N-terminal domain-containing protein [Paenibacillus sp.]
MPIKPFTIHIDQKEIEDLNRRLDFTRWPDQIPGSNWEYGIPLDFVKDMVRYWRDDFDWRQVEKKIHSYSNYIAHIDGLDIHFIHARGNGANPLPILIPHGWPSTFYEILDLIPYLTHPERFGGDPEDSFDVLGLFGQSHWVPHDLSRQSESLSCSRQRVIGC